MNCPKCNAKSMVKNTIYKTGFTLRYRQCLNKNCRWRFKTKEMLADEWNYKGIVLKIKKIINEVN